MSDEEIQWHHQLETRRRRALLESSIEQLEILSPAASQHEGTLVEGKSVPDALRRVASICRRSHLVARQLRERRQNRPPLEIADEYDVQDLLHALLRLHFDDIRPEEWTPSYAGKSSRMDFLLKPEQIVIETKVTREKRGTAQVSEELIIDAAHYREHPDCKTLVCFVHDPQGHISNPRGFEADIEKLSRPELQVICIITQ